MPTPSYWPIPYIIDPRHFALDAVVSFGVAVLLAVMLNAEAQAFAATFLGDHRDKPTDRFHFNAFLHLDILGTINFLVGGFGWGRTMAINPGKFAHPRLYTLIARLAGPLANLLLANIMGSMAFLLKAFAYEAHVFLMVLGVNVTVAIYNLLPLPPLLGGTLVSLLIPQQYQKIKSLFTQVGPFLIVALTLIERITHKEIFSQYLNPIIIKVFNFIVGL